MTCHRGARRPPPADGCPDRGKRFQPPWRACGRESIRGEQIVSPPLPGRPPRGHLGQSAAPPGPRNAHTPPKSASRARSRRSGRRFDGTGWRAIVSTALAQAHVFDGIDSCDHSYGSLRKNQLRRRRDGGHEQFRPTHTARAKSAVRNPRRTPVRSNPYFSLTAEFGCGSRGIRISGMSDDTGAMTSRRVPRTLPDGRTRGIRQAPDADGARPPLFLCTTTADSPAVASGRVTY